MFDREFWREYGAEILSFSLALAAFGLGCAALLLAEAK